MKGTIKSTSAEELTDKQAESSERKRKIERWVLYIKASQ